MNICEVGYVLPNGREPCAVCGATVKGPCRRPGEIERLRRVEDIVFKYIDRMTDVCPEDPAEKILSEFVRDIQNERL